MRSNPRVNRAYLAVACAAVLSACNGGSNASAPGMPFQQLAPPPAVQRPIETERRPTSSHKIQHVVIIVQENRSFNNLFYGYPGRNDREIRLKHLRPADHAAAGALETSWDIEHDLVGLRGACNGTGSIPGTDCQMNGFNNEGVGCGGRGNPVPQSEPAVQLRAAQRDEAILRHGQAIRVGRSDVRLELRREQLHLAPVPHRGAGRVGGELSVRRLGLPRRFGRYDRQASASNARYGKRIPKSSAGIRRRSATSSTPPGSPGPFTPSSYSTAIRGSGAPIRRSIISTTAQTGRKTSSRRRSQFFTDVSNGKLRAVSWITPTCENSDHAGSARTSGPSGSRRSSTRSANRNTGTRPRSSSFGTTTAAGTIRSRRRYVDYDGLGMRIPMLIVSPTRRKDESRTSTTSTAAS